jgi:hypothetical protein
MKGTHKQTNSAVIDVTAVFSDSEVENLAQLMRWVPPSIDAKARFADNVRKDARLLVEARSRLPISTIRRQAKRLWDLCVGITYADHRAAMADTSRKAKRARERSDGLAYQLARELESLPKEARAALLFAHRPDLPRPVEITERATRDTAVSQLRRVLASGGRWPSEGEEDSHAIEAGRPSVESRLELEDPSAGKSVATRFKPDLWLPSRANRLAAEHDNAEHRGRLKDQALRDFVQNLALTYLEATERPTPKVVNFRTPGPFLRLVRRCFQLLELPTGGIEGLINERGRIRATDEGKDPYLPPVE